tara:strand:+ start:375 stop:728 length:354 start_codon:yes stop_codon:yes gene_type:complete
MAITSDGTQAFGIESSPVTINAVVYVVESLSFSRTGNRADINDSNGEPLGSVVVPGRTEISGTIQLATGSTDIPAVGNAMVLSGTRNDGTFTLTSVDEAETQGDYVKVSFSGYKQIN